VDKDIKKMIFIPNLSFNFYDILIFISIANKKPKNASYTSLRQLFIGNMLVAN
jgi:hypothetical protein